MEYEITTHTGVRRDAASDGHVGIRLVGELGALGDEWLAHHGRTRFVAGAADVFVLESAAPLGRLLYAELFVAGKPWFVDRVVVREVASGETATFPVHGFVTSERRIAFEGHATLPQHDPPALAEARARELTQRRSTYEVDVPANGLPARLREQNLELLPIDEVFTPERTEEFDHAKRRAEWNLKLAFLGTMFDRWDAPIDEQRIYPILPKPAVSAHYAADSELVWQSVAGVAPNHLRRVASPDDLPAVFSAVKPAVDAILGDGGVDAAIASGRLYCLDDSILEGIPMFESEGVRRYAPPGACLFVAHGTALHPVAIRLSSEGPIFEPGDADGWLLAKTFVRAAEANIHQVITHAVRTHLAIEPFLLATMRCFASRHPIYKLMRRHFRGTIRINAEARQLLLARGGVFDEFIATGGPAQGHIHLAVKAYAAFELAQNEPEIDMARRGFDPSNVAIDYPFAEAARDLYLQIREYVHGTLAPYYSTPAAVAGDTELAAFLAELRSYARAGELAASDIDLAGLTRLLALVVYTGSVLHAAVNFQQYEHFGFVPNAPAAVRVPPPNTAEKTLSDAAWMKALPDFPQTARQVAVSYSLSRELEDDELLLPTGGRWKEDYFVEAGALAAIDHFHDALRQVKVRIEARNAHGRPYTCLLPDAIPTSTTI